MAHKTLIGGTAYEISGGKTLIDGTAYSLKNGKTLVGGTAYEIGFGGFTPILEFGTVTFTKHSIFQRYDVIVEISPLPNNVELVNALQINDEIIPLPYSNGANVNNNETLTIATKENLPINPPAGEFIVQINPTLSAISIMTGADLGTCNITIGIMK